MYKYCPNCGKEHTSDKMFCGSCGFNFAESNKSTSKSKRYITIIFAVIICFVATVCYTCYYMPRQPEYSLTKLSLSISNDDYDSFKKHIDFKNVIHEARLEAETFCLNEVYPIVHIKYPYNSDCKNIFYYEMALNAHLYTIEYVLQEGIENSFAYDKFDDKNFYSQEFLKKYNVTLLPDGKLPPDSDTSRLDKYLQSNTRYETPNCEWYYVDSLAYMLKNNAKYFKVDVVDIKKQGEGKALATVKVSFISPSSDIDTKVAFAGGITSIDDYTMLKRLLDNQNIQLEMRQNSDGTWKIIRIANITDMYRGLIRILDLAS